MKAIRVATINSGDPNRPGRIRLELRAQYGTEPVNGRQPKAGYRWYAENTAREMEIIEGQDDFKTVAQAMQALYSWYNVPEWQLVTAHIDNRGWTYANPLGGHVAR